MQVNTRACYPPYNFCAVKMLTPVFAGQETS